MHKDKLQEIITRKNERLESDAVATAENIINQIVELTGAIVDANNEIDRLRAELKKLEIQQVSPESILGKE